MAHHPVIVELPVSQGINALRDQRVKLHDPFCVRVINQLFARYCRERREIVADGEGGRVVTISGTNFNRAAGQDIQAERDLLVRPGMPPLLQFLAQHVKGEYDPAAKVWLIKIATVLLSGDLA